jgi:hypothetical protein
MFKEKHHLHHSFQTRPGGRPGPRPGSILFFFKSKRRRFSKKQMLTGHNRVFDRVADFFLPLFFLQPDPAPAPARPTEPGFKTMTSIESLFSR